MSIWTRPLFGKAAPATPASEAQVRCARMRAARFDDLMPVLVVAWVLGSALVFGVLIGTFSLGILRLGGPPDSILRGLAKGVGPTSVALGLGGVALFAWGFPRAARWIVDRQAPTLTREQHARGRRARRQAPWILGGLGLLYVVVTALMLALFSWQAGLMVLGKTAAIGGAIVAGIGLFGRRGTRLVCARCGYPMGSWRAAPDRCPECGRDWRRPWGARLGERAVRRHLVWAGLVCLVLSVALTVAALVPSALR